MGSSLEEETGSLELGRKWRGDIKDGSRNSKAAKQKTCSRLPPRGTVTLRGPGEIPDHRFSIDWHRNLEIISESTKQYTPTESDVGHQLEVRCHALHSLTGHLLAEVSMATAAVRACPTDFSSTAFLPIADSLKEPLRILTYNVLSPLNIKIVQLGH
ncbi:uncharacterized protein A4U43_C08F21640 [Asparagus officinalis]|nr:uncharacterized protein A4U43_C08F21640 [Asparagus officinalis]